MVIPGWLGSQKRIPSPREAFARPVRPASAWTNPWGDIVLVRILFIITYPSPAAPLRGPGGLVSHPLFAPQAAGGNLWPCPETRPQSLTDQLWSPICCHRRAGGYSEGRVGMLASGHSVCSLRYARPHPCRPLHRHHRLHRRRRGRGGSSPRCVRVVHLGRSTWHAISGRGG